MLQRSSDELVGEGDDDPGTGGRVVEDPFVRAVPVLAEDQPLDTELHQLRLPRPAGTRPPLLVVDGPHPP